MTSFVSTFANPLMSAFSSPSAYNLPTGATRDVADRPAVHASLVVDQKWYDMLLHLEEYSISNQLHKLKINSFLCFVAKYSYKILADLRKNLLDAKVCNCFCLKSWKHAMTIFTVYSLP